MKNKSKKKLPHTIELKVVKTSLGYTVYDVNSKDSIDVFPDDAEGRERLLEYLSFMMNKKVEPFFQD